VIAIAEWHRTWPLIELSVHLCGIGDRGALALLQAAEENRIGSLTLDTESLSEGVRMNLSERLENV